MTNGRGWWAYSGGVAGGAGSCDHPAVNLAGIIDGHRAEAPALIVGERVRSFGELREGVGRARGALAAAGAEPGDRVAIVAGNNERFVEAYLAALGIGAVVVPLNPLSPIAELRREMDLVGVRIVVTEGGDPSGRDRLAIDRVVVDSFDRGTPVPIHDVGRDSIAIAIFTSGTAGAPRAAMLTHGNLLANVEQVRAHGDGAAAARPDDVVLGALPLFHVFGLNTVLVAALHAGACTVLVEHFDPREVLALIARRRVTVVPGVAAMWAAIAELDETAPDRCLVGAIRRVRGGQAVARRRRTAARPIRFRRARRLRVDGGVADRRARCRDRCSAGIDRTPGAGRRDAARGRERRRRSRR